MQVVYVFPLGWVAIVLIFLILGSVGIINDFFNDLPGYMWAALFLLLIIFGVIHFVTRIRNIQDNASNMALRGFSKLSYIIRTIMVSAFMIASTYMFMEAWTVSSDKSLNPGSWGWDCLFSNLWAGIASIGIALASWIWDIIRVEGISKEKGNRLAILNFIVSAAFCAASILICLFVLLGGYGSRINYYFNEYEQTEKYVMTKDGIAYIGESEGLLTQNMDRNVNAGTEFWLAEEYEEDEYLEVYNENTWGWVHSSSLEKK